MAGEADDHTPPAVKSASCVVVPAQTEAIPVIGAITGSGLTVTVRVTVFEHPPVVTVYEITDVPPDTPVTRPEASTVAIPEFELNQTPPVVTSASCVVDPSHTVAVPVIEATTGSGLTVTVRVATFVQPPLVTVYDTTEVPGVIPETRPAAFTVATAGVELDQTPPEVRSASCVVDPAQTVAVPVIAATTGRAFTVTLRAVVFEQPPEVTVYEIIALPAAIPVTSPEALTVATAGESDAQVPPPVISDNCVVEPAQTVATPVIGATTGSGFTVTVMFEVFVQPPDVTVYEITEVPAEIPVTRPEASTVATPVFALDHTPPGVMSESCVDDPAHTVAVPVTGATTGRLRTVTGSVVILEAQPPTGV